MVTFYPDVSCWAWVMADGVDQPDVAERPREVPGHLAAGRRLVPEAMPFITSDILQIDVLVAEVCLQRDCHQRQNAVHA
jgi:hypothetical protein